MPLSCFPDNPLVPNPAVLDIFGRLTLWEKLLLGAVSRAWRHTLRDSGLWSTVDLSTAGLRF